MKQTVYFYCRGKDYYAFKMLNVTADSWRDHGWEVELLEDTPANYGPFYEYACEVWEAGARDFYNPRAHYYFGLWEKFDAAWKECVREKLPGIFLCDIDIVNKGFPHHGNKVKFPHDEGSAATNDRMLYPTVYGSENFETPIYIPVNAFAPMITRFAGNEKEFKSGLVPELVPAAKYDDLPKNLWTPKNIGDRCQTFDRLLWPKQVLAHYEFKNHDLWTTPTTPTTT